MPVEPLFFLTDFKVAAAAASDVPVLATSELGVGAGEEMTEALVLTVAESA